MKSNIRPLLAKVHEALLPIVALTIPLSIRLNNPIILLLFSVFLFQIEKLKKNHFIIATFIFVGAYMLSLIYTEDLKDGYASVERKVLFTLLITSILWSRTIINSATLNRIVIFFIIGSALACIYNIMSLDIDLFEKLEIEIHNSYLAIFLVFSIFYLLINFQPYSWYIISVVVILTIFLIFLSAKMPIVVFVILLIIFVLIDKSNKEKLLIRLTLLIPMLFLTVVMITQIENTAVRFKQFFINLDDTRRDNWTAGVKVIKENFFLGVGAGDIEEELNKYRKQNWFDGYNQYNSHNQYLDTQIRTGIIGSIGLLGMIVVQIMLSLKSHNKTHLFFVLIFSLSLLTESMLEVQRGLVFFAFFSSLFIKLDSYE